MSSLAPLGSPETRSRLRLDFLSLLQINQHLDLLRVSVCFLWVVIGCSWRQWRNGSGGEMAVRAGAQNPKWEESCHRHACSLGCPNTWDFSLTWSWGRLSSFLYLIIMLAVAICSKLLSLIHWANTGFSGWCYFTLEAAVFARFGCSIFVWSSFGSGV